MLAARTRPCLSPSAGMSSWATVLEIRRACRSPDRSLSPEHSLPAISRRRHVGCTPGSPHDRDGKTTLLVDTPDATADRATGVAELGRAICRVVSTRWIDPRCRRELRRLEALAFVPSSRHRARDAPCRRPTPRDMAVQWTEGAQRGLADTG